MVIIFCLSTHNSLIEDTATHKLLINVLHTNIIVIMVVQSWSRLWKKPVESFWRSSDVIPKLSMKIRQIFRRSKVFYSFWPWQQTRLFRFYELFLSHQYLFFFFFCLKIPKQSFYFYKQSSFLKMQASICTLRYVSPYAEPIPVPACLVVSMCPNYVSPTNSLSLRSQINCHFLREVFPLIRCSLPQSPLYFLRKSSGFFFFLTSTACLFFVFIFLSSFSPTDCEIH